jgi:hypothetical protein
VSWDQRFFDPIILDGRKPLVTLRDAAEYMMQALLLVAEHDGPAMFARIGVMKALNRNIERTFNPDRKDTHWGQRKLKREQ